MVRRFGVPAAQHEDAVQEVWLVAYRRLDTLEPDASAKAWLSTITRRIAFRLRRTERRRRRKIEAVQVAAERSSVVPVEAQDARRLLDALFERLDDEQRTALILASVHGLTGPEIAESLQIPLNTAYSRVRLARRKVQQFTVEVGTEYATVLQVLRRREQPPRRAAAHAWMLLVPQLPGAVGSTGAATGLGGGAWSLLGGASGIKTFVTTAAIGMVGLLAAKVTIDEPGTPASSVPGPSPSAIASNLAVPDVAASVSPEAPVLAPERPRSEPSPIVSVAPLRSVAVASPRIGARPSVEPAPTEDATLSAEAELLGRAQQSLRAGRPGDALRLLEEHERRFAEGKLVDARKGARVRALCDLGRGAQARAEARLLVRAHPGSPVAAGVLDTCS